MRINHLEEKMRFLLLALGLLCLFLLAGSLLERAYARYQTNVKLNASIDRALYVLGEDKMSFNLEPDRIVPSDDPFVYKFSISNFDDKEDSDVDISYTVDVRTTTNLPLTIELYRNEVYGEGNPTNLLGGAVIKQDVDGAWYRTYKPSEEFEMPFDQNVTDIYTLVVVFPKIYAEDRNYSKFKTINIKMEVTLCNL